MRISDWSSDVCSSDLIPALVLATLAAIIASQAVITGAYSVTKQAIQLGFLPRMAVRYTSARDAGQIYMPGVNFTLMVAVIAVVEMFGSSSALAGAYGLDVTLTMMTTSFLAFFVMSQHFNLGQAIGRSSWRERGVQVGLIAVVA